MDRFRMLAAKSITMRATCAIAAECTTVKDFRDFNCL